MEVKESSRGPQIIVSRAHKNMLRRLLEYEVPEIYNGQVEIKSIAREAGYRSKVAVSALQPGVDPVGACVGIKGTRIQNIVRELKDEKIDVIEWNTDPQVFIAKALSPARVTGVYLEEELDAGNTATVIVPDDQLSLAIGREGQNARLAAKLTGWRIDIKSVSEAAIDAYGTIQDSPVSAVAEAHPDLAEEVNRIIEKKRAEKPVQPEEYATLARFVQLAELELLKTREQARVKRRKAYDRVRPTIPAFAFSMPLSELELAEDIENAVKFLPNVGELMIRLLVDESNLQAALRSGNAGADAMDAIKEAIDSLVLARQVELEAMAADTPAVAEPVVEAAPAVVGAEAPAEDEEAPPAFVDDAPAGSRLQRFAQLEQKAKQLQRQQQERSKPARVEQPKGERPVAQVASEPDLDGDADSADVAGKKKDKKQKQRGRELVFDERRGEVVAKRKRKGNRRDWANYPEEE
jgi:N utilization substance protein A